MKNEEVLFYVTQEKKGMQIRWQIPGVSSVSDYLYWAKDLGAIYEMHVALDRGMTAARLYAREGTWGEHRSDIFWNPGWACFGREGYRYIHGLIHHGLDGLPNSFVRSLPHDKQIFEVSGVGVGLFRMTLDEWNSHYYDNYSDLGKLAREGKPEVWKDTQRLDWLIEALFSVSSEFGPDALKSILSNRISPRDEIDRAMGQK